MAEMVAMMKPAMRAMRRSIKRRRSCCAGPASPSLRAAAEESHAADRHDHLAFLVDHLAQCLERAAIGPALGRDGIDDGEPAGERVTGAHRLQPLDLVDARRAHAV